MPSLPSSHMELYFSAQVLFHKNLFTFFIHNFQLWTLSYLRKEIYGKLFIECLRKREQTESFLIKVKNCIYLKMKIYRSVRINNLKATFKATSVHHKEKKIVKLFCSNYFFIFLHRVMKLFNCISLMLKGAEKESLSDLVVNKKNECRYKKAEGKNEVTLHNKS